jgi:threonine dehydratase
VFCLINLENFEQARLQLKGISHQTPVDFSKTFSEISGNNIFLKLENLQKTGSFKVRGAYNKIMSLSHEERKHGVIAASAGNHAQGVAFASTMAKIKSTIVMPKGAPLTKVEATKNYGASVILHGDTFDEALEYTVAIQKQAGATFVHPFDDLEVITGQGTIGLELLEQIPNIDAVVCPIGGGGLISGISAVLKERNPNVKIYGVEAAVCPSMLTSLKEKIPVKVTLTETIADGIAVKRPGNLTYSLIERYIDDIVSVEEMEISQTMLHLLERNKLLVEGSGAVSLAAVLYGKLPLKGKNVVTLISGGNVDINFVSRLIVHGLVDAGRFLKFSTLVPDKPGQLNKLLSIIAQLEANVLSVHHQRIGSKVFPGKTEIDFSLETKNNSHIQEIEKALMDAGYSIRKTL